MDTSTTFDHLDTREGCTRAFDVMKQLRPHLTNAEAFCTQLAAQHEQGYRLLAACRGGDVLGLAGYRTQTNLLYGRFVYVDDLVVAQHLQRGGIGARLLDAVRHIARDMKCRHFVLDTGLHMALAQRFYYRNGLLARGMHFVEAFDTANGVRAMNLLFLNASPHSASSHGHRLASEMIDTLRKTAPVDVIERDLAAAPLASIMRGYARAITSREPDTRMFDLSEH